MNGTLVNNMSTYVPSHTNVNTHGGLNADHYRGPYTPNN